MGCLNTKSPVWPEPVCETKPKMSAHVYHRAAKTNLPIPQTVQLKPEPDPKGFQSYQTPEDAFCAICLDDYANAPPRWLPCSHCYHVPCITEWFQYSGTQRCPLCQMNFQNSPDDVDELWLKFVSLKV